jgi:hypothetical protein
VIGSEPIIVELDLRPLQDAVVILGAAIGLAAAADVIPPGEGEYFKKLVWPTGALLLIPAIWMIIQIVPLPLFANPAWESASQALGITISGSITVDIGATITCFIRYLGLAGVFTLAVISTISRTRAPLMLIALTTAAVALSITSIGRHVLAVSLPSFSEAGRRLNDTADCAALGMALCCATGMLFYERHETRGRGRTASRRNAALGIVATVCGFALCGLSAAISGGVKSILVSAAGVYCFVVVSAARRLALAKGVSLLTLGVGLIGLMIMMDKTDADQVPMIAPSPQVHALELLPLQRLLADSPSFGTGAGTFEAVTPLFKSSDNDLRSQSSPAFITFGVEMGRWFLGLLILVWIAATMLLFNAALQRERDSFYPIAGVAILAALLFASTVDSGVLQPGTSVLAVASLGLALAQSKSRTSS